MQNVLTKEVLQTWAIRVGNTKILKRAIVGCQGKRTSYEHDKTKKKKMRSHQYFLYGLHLAIWKPRKRRNLLVYSYASWLPFIIAYNKGIYNLAVPPPFEDHVIWNILIALLTFKQLCSCTRVDLVKETQVLSKLNT